MRVRLCPRSGPTSPPSVGARLGRARWAMSPVGPSLPFAALQHYDCYWGTPDLKVDGEDQRDELNRTPDDWVSVVLGNAIIFRMDKVLAVNSLKPAKCEVTSSHVLKMFNKRIIHGSTA